MLVSLFKGLLGFVVLSLSAVAQTSAPNEWTWMGGLSTGGAAPVYGTLGVPAAGNIPGPRYQASTWTDSSGNFWLFGGSGGFGTLFVRFNDLWMLNPSPKQWTWMGGSSLYSSQVGPSGVSGPSGVYGTLGTPAAGNFPGGRADGTNWTDNSGHFWLFGGQGFDASGSFGVLNDLWEFNPSTKEWAWMGGSSTIGNSCFAFDIGGPGEMNCARTGVYGTLGTPAAENTPGSRQGAMGWADSKGNLWLFGGWGYDIGNQVQFYFNDLWEFTPLTKEWAWIGGSSTGAGSHCFKSSMLFYLSCGEPGAYGTLGTPASGSNPGARTAASSWVDSSGNFWLFGGQGFDSNGQFSDLNDLWEFNPSTKQWTWRNGSSTVNGSNAGPGGVFGMLGTPAATNIPPTRWGASSWIDSNGNLWLFGGEETGWYGNAGFSTLNDVWEFNPSTNEWAWMGGSETSIPPTTGVYGTLGTPAPGNNPGERFGASSWTDSSGNFWLFGGQFPLGQTQVNTLNGNDLWEYQPANGPLPKTSTPTFSVPAGTYTGSLTVKISDATNGATIYFTTDGSTPTTSSTVFYSNSSISIPYSATLKAIAVASGCLNSAVATATYTLPPPAATPTFSEPGGTYTATQNVTISDATAGTTIYYTLNGSTPTTSSTVYSGPITVSGSALIQAIAVASGFSNSLVASATYVINLSQGFSVAASPASLSMSGGQSGTSTISITPLNGFNSTVSFVCSGLPSGISCSFSPPTATPSGTVASTTLTVTTSTTTAEYRRNSNSLFSGSALTIALCFFGSKKRRLQMLLALSLVGLCLLNGCGGASSTSALPSTTQPVSSTITVTATAGSLQHTTTILLTVN
jgi:N-acetylneuraminic acid mutarotase